MICGTIPALRPLFGLKGPKKSQSTPQGYQVHSSATKPSVSRWGYAKGPARGFGASFTAKTTKGDLTSPSEERIVPGQELNAIRKTVDYEVNNERGQASEPRDEGRHYGWNNV